MVRKLKKHQRSTYTSSREAFNNLWQFLFRLNFRRKRWSLSGIDWGLRITLASIEHLEGIERRGFWADRIFPIIEEDE